MSPLDDPDFMVATDEPAADEDYANLDAPPEAFDLDEPPPPPPVDYDGEETNIAKLLPFKFLQNLAGRVKTSADESYKSSAKRRENIAQNLQLYNGDIPDAGADQEMITPMHLPFAKRGVRIFKAKLFPALYPPDGDIVKLRVRSPELETTANNCTTHMNFQLTNQIVEYIPSHDRGMTQGLIEGSFFETWWYDVIQQRPCQEISLAEDFWIPYTAKTDRPDLADVAFKTWIKPMQMHQLEALEASGYYIGVTKKFDHPDGQATLPIYGPNSYDAAGTPNDSPGMPDARETPVKDVADDNSGLEKQSSDTDGPRKLMEQDRWVKLPGEDVQRLVTICLDDATQTILRVSLCEMVDMADKVRHDREMQAWEQTEMANQQMHVEATAQHQEMAALAGSLDPMTGELFPEAGAPPMPPEPAPMPAPPKKVPWHRHTKFDCDVAPEGALGHGVVDDVKGHNVLANKVATRSVSLSSLNMLPTGIASRQSKFGRDGFKLKLGQINESPLSPDQVKNGAGLFMLQFPPPDPNAYRMIELADKSSQEVTAFDIAAGGSGKSGETATESEMRHSNATDNISVVAQRYNRSRAMSLKNLAYINSLTIPDEGVTLYQDGGPITVYRQDYEKILGELEVTFTCDPTMESKPLRKKRAQEMLSAIGVVIGPGPAGVPSVPPEVAIQLQRWAVTNVLKTSDAPKWVLDLINNAPLPAPPPPPGMGPPGEGQGPNGQGMDGPGQGPPGGGGGGPQGPPSNP